MDSLTHQKARLRSIVKPKQACWIRQWLSHEKRAASAALGISEQRGTARSGAARPQPVVAGLNSSSSNLACAAANRAIGTRGDEQDT
jgi:hypothetical protein